MPREDVFAQMASFESFMLCSPCFSGSDASISPAVELSVSIAMVCFLFLENIIGCGVYFLVMESEWDLSDNYGDISHANCLSKKVPNFLNPSLRKLVHGCGLWWKS